MRDVQISTLSEYITFIKEITEIGFSFFRGQDSCMFQKLLPSLLRENTSGVRLFSDQCDRNFINTFKSRGISHLNFTPQSDWEWMSTAQHYGLPTRLLDWSQSPLSALFFAVENDRFIYKHDDDCSVIWCLNPTSLNEKLRFIEDYTIIPNIIDNTTLLQTNLTQKYGVGVNLQHQIHPIALICPSSNHRINAQKGVFTLFPLNALPLEQMEGADDILCKVTINKSDKYEIKRQLFDIGITYSNIYPDLDSICEDIKFEYAKNS